jgi:hypothetical protein
MVQRYLAPSRLETGHHRQLSAIFNRLQPAPVPRIKLKGSKRETIQLYQQYATLNAITAILKRKELENHQPSALRARPSNQTTHLANHAWQQMGTLRRSHCKLTSSRNSSPSSPSAKLNLRYPKQTAAQRARPRAQRP